jgi:hypothetical protein
MTSSRRGNCWKAGRRVCPSYGEGHQIDSAPFFSAVAPRLCISFRCVVAVRLAPLLSDLPHGTREDSRIRIVASAGFDAFHGAFHVAPRYVGPKIRGYSVARIGAARSVKLLAQSDVQGTDIWILFSYS